MQQIMRFAALVALSWIVLCAEAYCDTVGEMRPEDHLVAIGPALRNLDYKGVFVYEQGGQRTNQQWVHAVRNGIEYERLLGLDGAHREVLRQRPLGCMQHSEKAIHAQLLTALTGNINAFGAYYDVALTGNDTVAGRQAYVILVKPKDEYRFGYRFFADVETHLLLGADMLDVQGNVLEKFRFIQLRIGNVAESDLAALTSSPIQMDASQCEAQGKPAVTLSNPHWVLDSPAGFTLCNQERRKQGNEEEDVLMYSDGLSHFTVFIRPQSKPSQDELMQQGGSMQRGNTLLRSESLEFNDQMYAVTIVGEIPEVTSRKVISQIKPVSAP